MSRKVFTTNKSFRHQEGRHRLEKFHRQEESSPPIRVFTDNKSLHARRFFTIRNSLHTKKILHHRK
jgi:hypothetical protein